MTLEQLRQPIEEEYRWFCDAFDRHAGGDVPLLKEVGNHLAATPGKRLRPILVLLSAKLFPHYADRRRAALMAAAVEMLHNATLMHDDVVDDSDSRRGRPSIRGRWGNPAAVLCGDYYLAQVMLLLQEIDDHETATIVNNAVRAMCQGELVQLALQKGSRPQEEIYIDIIGRKTAALMAACCEIGARNFAVPHNEEQDWLKDFGYHYGVVYQIRDDINDGGHELPADVDTDSLIARHAALARKALAPLPHSEVKELLLGLLLPTAPQPV